MKAVLFDDLPAEIRRQLESLLPDTGLIDSLESKNRLAAVWNEKFDLFCSQINALGMDFTTHMDLMDKRGAILLTYSGSLISLGPESDEGRWLEYASIKFRTDVPDIAHGKSARLSCPLEQGHPAEFSGCSLKKTSSLYRIAVCPEGTTSEDQQKRIREATIFLTNGFIHINKSLSTGEETGLEQFNLKTIVAYVARKNQLTRQQARSVIDDYLSTVESGVLLGSRVSVGKLGHAGLRVQPARKARIIKNPQTGADLVIPAKAECLVPRFGFSSLFKEKCSRIDPDLFKGDPDEQEEQD